MKKSLNTKLLLVLFLTFIVLKSSFSANLKLKTDSKNKQDFFNTFIDLSGLREFKKAPNIKTPLQLNQNNDISCMTKENKPLYDCLWFSDMSFTIPSKSNGYPLACNNGHNKKYGNTYDGYLWNGLWCQQAISFFYDKWHCKSFTKIEYPLYVEFATKRIYCASKDQKNCIKMTDDECSKIQDTWGIYRLDIGNQGSYTDGEAQKLSGGNNFILHEVLALPDFTPFQVQIGTPVASWSGEIVNFLKRDLITFAIPADLKLLNFRVKTPIIGRDGNGSTFGKIKLELKLNDRLLGVQELIDPKQSHLRSFEFTGILKNIAKGNYNLYINATGYQNVKVFGGEYVIDFVGYK